MSWPTAPLAEVAEFRLGKMLDRRKNRGSLRPYLANVNVRWGRFDLQNLRKMRFEDHELDKYGLTYGDIVMCEGGEPGRCALWKVRRSGMMIQKALHRIRPANGVTSEFLYYNLSYRGRAGLLAPLFTGATIKHLPREKLARAMVDVPPLATQRRIASVLAAYDDLIENNRRRIRLLERAARLLYREWFVHLRFPGHEQVGVVDGVPEGWERKVALDVMDVRSGGTPRTTVSKYWDGDIPFFTPKDATDCIYAYKTERWLTEDGLRNCNSSLFPKDTVFITARGTVGKTFLALTDMAMNQSCYGLIAGPPLNQAFLLFALREAVDEFHSRAVGSVFGAIVRDTFAQIPLLVPTEDLVERFSGIVRPMLRQVEMLLHENTHLTQARDLLLPRLMNGEITA